MNYARQYPKFWLFYFVFSVLSIFVSVVYDLLAKTEPFNWYSSIGVLLALLGLQPLYGYIRQRRYNPRWLWVILFFFYSFSILVIGLICFFIAASEPSLMPILGFIGMALYSGPHLLALHQYVYKSPHLWSAS